MKKNKKIAMLFLIIASLVGALLLIGCPADLQKSGNANIYKIAFIDYGKLPSTLYARDDSVTNVITDVPGNKYSLTFQVICSPSTKIEIIDASTDVEYLGNMMWRATLKNNAVELNNITADGGIDSSIAKNINRFSIKTTAEDGKVKIYDYAIATSLTLQSFKIKSTGSAKGVDILSDKSAVVVEQGQSNEQTKLISTDYGTARIDLSSDIDANKLKSVVIEFESNASKVTAELMRRTNATTTSVTDCGVQTSGDSTADFYNNARMRYKLCSVDGTFKYYDAGVILDGNKQVAVDSDGNPVYDYCPYTDAELNYKLSISPSKDSITILAMVDNTSDNAYITGDRDFRKVYLGDTATYSSDGAAAMAPGKKMNIVYSIDKDKKLTDRQASYMGKYIRSYTIRKIDDDASLSDLIFNIYCFSKDTGINGLTAKNFNLTMGKVPYIGSNLFSNMPALAIDWKIGLADYIIVPELFLRGWIINLMWDAAPKAKFENAVDHPEYSGQYSIMKTRTFTCYDNGLNNESYDDIFEAPDLTALATGDDAVRNDRFKQRGPGLNNWKIAEGILGTSRWDVPAFHFAKVSSSASDNVEFSSSLSSPKWQACQTGSSKPNFDNDFKTGYRYTWYIKDFLKGSAAKIMILEEPPL